MFRGENTLSGILKKREHGELLLSEEEGKKFLGTIGINIPKGILVGSFDELKQAVLKLRYPVVIKGLVEGITHKSDYGLVKVGISNDSELENSFSVIVDKCRELGKDWKVLIEQQKSGSLEVVAGLTTDANFGKVVMFGLGGIFVEVIKDVSFKLCPITRKDAEDMINSLQAQSIFKGARGKKPVDTGKIMDFLLSIGGQDGIAGKYRDIIDTVEINPAIIDENGTITALDAVVKLAPETGTEGTVSESEPVDMNRLFAPQTMGVVGISPDRSSFAKEFLAASLELGYKGRVYPINIKHDGKEVLGWRVYDRISSVPEDIDYLYVCIPAAAIPELLQDGKGKVRFAHIITSGFGEVGAEGKKTEQTVLAGARESNIRLIGPNCIGMYSPGAGITLIEGAPVEVGSIGLISQSGGIATDTIRMGGALGLRFSKVISVGNSIDLGIEDFLEYLGRDPQTKIIGIYSEQVKNGNRLSRLLSEICRVKPVLILKGGRSALGAKAASSHTGALASDIRLWEAMCRQHGAILTKSFNEFVNALLAFQNMDPCAENTVFMFGQSGGTTVLAADQCDENSLAVPEFDAKLEKEILSLGVPPGTSVKNPIDAPIGTLAVGKGKIVKDIFEVVSKNKEFSYDLLHFNVQNILSYSRIGYEIINNMVDLAIERGGVGGPRYRRLALVIRGNREQEVENIVREQSSRAAKAGVAVFPDLGDALQSIGTLVKYGAWLKS